MLIQAKTCSVQHHTDGAELDVCYNTSTRTTKMFTVPSCLPVDRQKLCIAYRLPGEMTWHRSFINEVYPNLLEAYQALPAWLQATGKYMGETVGNVYYPTRGECLEYDIVKEIDAVCINWHRPYIEDLGHQIDQPLTAADIAEKVTWVS